MGMGMGMGSRRRLLPTMCRNRLSTCIRVQLPRADTKTASRSDLQERRSTFGCGETQLDGSSGKRVVVVVDSSREAKAALQWALSHAVQSHDTVVLLDVVQPSAKHDDQYEKGIRNAKSYELLYDMRRICQAKKPEVKVELSLVQGKERGPTIVNESKLQRASLLVLGQKKRSIRCRLLMMWAGRRSGGTGEAVKYCIQNANCMTLAVRRKSRRGGGYLITSRHHKDFWLLA